MESGTLEISGRRTRPRIRVSFGVILAALWVAGCGSVDATADFAQTASLIRERTGSPDAYEPARDAAGVERSVQAMLGDGLTADEAVRIALLRNPTLQGMFEDVGVSRAELVRAGLPSNPLFSLSLRFPEPGGLANVTTSFTQTVVDLLLMPARKRARRAELEAARARTARYAVQLAGRVKRTFYEGLALGKAAGLAERELAEARHAVDLARRRLAAGQGDAIDVNLARAGVLDVQRGLLRLRRDLRVGRVALARLIGLVRGARLPVLDGELPRPERIAAERDLEDLARTRRLDVRVATLALRAAEAELGVEKGRVVPDLAIGVERERAETPPSLVGPTIQGSLPLWNQNQPATARARFLARRARRAVDAALDVAVRDVRAAVIAVESGGRLVRMFEEEVLPLARDNVGAASRAYRTGQRDILVLLAAQRALIAQRRAWVDALRDYAAAVADLEEAVGGRILRQLPAPDAAR